MCYELWRRNATRSNQEEANKRAQEIIERAKTSKPSPKTPEPVVIEKGKETVPA